MVRTVGKEDSIRTNKTLVVPSREDSLLRAELEGEGPYSLGQSTGGGAARKPIEMVAPIEGIVIERFDIKRENFGIRIAASPDTQIVAADERRGGDESLDPRNGLPDRNTALQQPDIDL